MRKKSILHVTCICTIGMCITFTITRFSLLSKLQSCTLQAKPFMERPAFVSLVQTKEATVQELRNATDIREGLGVIYMLTRNLDFSSNGRLQQSLSSLRKYILPSNNYPLIIFHDVRHNDAHSKQVIRQLLSPHSVLFEAVKFSLPNADLDVSRFKAVGPTNMGYRYMCRFHAVQALMLPVFDRFKFYMRIDDDCLFLEPYKIDIFKAFQEQNIDYGYASLYADSKEHYMSHIYDSTVSYIKRNKLKTTFFKEWDEEDNFYNNFEVSRISFWRNHNVQSYLKAMDRENGIFYYRWGDAPLKTYSVAMFMHWNRTRCLHDLPYFHNPYKYSKSASKCFYFMSGYNRHYRKARSMNIKHLKVSRIFGNYSIEVV